MRTASDIWISDLFKTKGNWLGDSKVIDHLVRRYFNQVLNHGKETEDEFGEHVKSQSHSFAKVLLGQNPTFTGPKWFAPGQIDAWVATKLAIESEDPEERVAGGLFRAALEVFELAASMKNQNVLPEQWQWQVTALVEKYVGILLGLPGGAYSQPEPPPPQPPKLVNRLQKSLIRKDHCKPGQNPERDHCTQAGRDQPPSGSSEAKPDANPDAAKARSVVQAAFEGLKVTKDHVKQVAVKVGAAVWNGLPAPAKKGLAKTWAAAKYIEHKAMSGFRASRDMASQVGQQWGLSEKTANRVAMVMSVMDVAAGWTVNPALGATAGLAVGGPAGAVAGAKVAAWMPVFSLGFIAASTAVNPFRTVSAAKAMIAKRKAAKPGGKKDHMKRIRSVIKSKEGGNEDMAHIAKRLSEVGEDKHDWYLALLSAALDDTGGDLGQAIESADVAFKENPEEPADHASMFSLEER